jgi:hypothetical protein
MKDWKLCLLFFIYVNEEKAQSPQFDTLWFESTPRQKRIYFDSTQRSEIWQIGEAQKLIFDSAYSRKFALITDTILNYSANSCDTFSLGFEKYGAITTIEFKHRYDLDSLHVCGNIDISADSGISWHLLHDTINAINLLHQISNSFVPDATNLTNFYIKHNPTHDRNGFTGQSKNWETSSIEFPCLAIKRP